MGQRRTGAAAAEGRGGEEERHRGARQRDAGGEPETPAAPERDTEFEGVSVNCVMGICLLYT